MRKELNSQRIFLVHQHGCRFIVLEHQYGRRDVMWKRSILHLNGAFSHDVTATVLVFQDNPVGIELFSYVKTFFCSNKSA